MRSMGRGTTEGGGGVTGRRLSPSSARRPASLPGHPSTMLRMVPLPISRWGGRKLRVHLVVEMPDAGLQRAEGQLFDHPRRKPLLAERGGAVILAAEHALVEQG